MRYFYLIAILVVSFQQAICQTVEPYRSKLVRVGYGLAVAGRGDVPGQQLMLGLQNQLSRHSLLDIRLAGTLIEMNKTWHQTYTVMDKSNGIALEADYGYTFHLGRLMFYPSLGPAIRYSHEVYPEYISIAYDPTGSGNIINFEAPSKEIRVIKLGVTGGLNFDVRVFRTLSLGLRTSVQVYNGNTIQFVGVTMKNTNWHF